MLVGPRRGLLRSAPVVATSAPTWTKKVGPAIQTVGFGSTSATFSSQAINNSSTSDYIIVKVGSKDAHITSVTIGGDAMTKACESGTDDFSAFIWYRTGNIYTTPDIVINAGAYLDRCGITAGILTGVTSLGTTQSLPLGFNADPHTTSAITVPSTGFGLFIHISGVDASPTVNTGTQDYYTASGDNSFSIVTGYISASGSQTPSVSGFGFNGSAMTAAPWGP